MAYRVKNRIGLVYSEDVVGRNCHIASQILPALNKKYFVEIRIPISGFDSNESERDTDVRKILKAEKYPEITYQSSSFTRKEWLEMAKSKLFSLEGKLKISGKWYRVSADLLFQKVAEREAEIDGVIRTKFKTFELKAPVLGIGLAQVLDDIEIHFHIISTKTLGMNIFLGYGDGLDFKFDSK